MGSEDVFISPVRDLVYFEMLIFPAVRRASLGAVCLYDFSL